MKKIVAVVAALFLIFSSSVLAANQSDQSDSNAKTMIQTASKYKNGQKMSLIDTYNVLSLAKRKVKAQGFLDYTQNFSISKNISINSPGAYTFKLTGSATQTSGIFNTTDKFNLTVSGSSPAGKTMIKPSSITINFYDYVFVVSALPPMVTKSSEVSKTATCYNTITCKLNGTGSYNDLSTLGYLAAEMVITYPTGTFTFAADVK